MICFLIFFSVISGDEVTVADMGQVNPDMGQVNPDIGQVNNNRTQQSVNSVQYSWEKMLKSC